MGKRYLVHYTIWFDNVREKNTEYMRAVMPLQDRSGYLLVNMHEECFKEDLIILDEKIKKEIIEKVLKLDLKFIRIVDFKMEMVPEINIYL